MNICHRRSVQAGCTGQILQLLFAGVIPESMSWHCLRLANFSGTLNPSCPESKSSAPCTAKATVPQSLWGQKALEASSAISSWLCSATHPGSIKTPEPCLARVGAHLPARPPHTQCLGA